MFARSDSQRRRGDGQSPSGIGRGFPPSRHVRLIQSHHDRSGGGCGCDRTVSAEKTVMIVTIVRYKSRCMRVWPVSRRKYLHRLCEIGRDPYVLQSNGNIFTPLILGQSQGEHPRSHCCAQGHAIRNFGRAGLQTILRQSIQYGYLPRARRATPVVVFYQ